MADPKNDASTEIEPAVEAFCRSLNADLAKWRERVAAEAGEAFGTDKSCGVAYMAEVKFKLSKTKDSKARTPAEQAEQVARGKSWVCWGAHMSDKARHVIMTADGKVRWDPAVVFHRYFAEFTKKWGAHMKSNGLLNYNSGDGYASGDEFHLELPDARIDKGDKRAAACLKEYVRLTREEGQKPNAKFEKDYKKLLQPYLDEYEE